MADLSKVLRNAVAFVVLCAFVGAAANTAAAAVLTWNSAASGPPVVDGDGAWGSGSHWWNNAGNLAWTNSASDTALFGAFAGSSPRTITVSGSQSVGGLTFQSQAYALADGGGTLNLAGSVTVVTVNAVSGTIGTIITGAGGLTKSGTGVLALTAVNNYTGPTTIDGGVLQLSTSNGALGALASPTIAIDHGGLLALGAADVLGYTTGREALVINGGTVTNMTASGRVTLQNAVAMTGGVLTGTGTGDSGGVYSFSTSNGFNATSDSSGNAAVVSASSISPQNADASFHVTRGTANPTSDLTVFSSIIPFGTRNYGIVKSGNGVLTLAGSNIYTGATTVSGGTLLLGNGGARGSLLPSGSIVNNAVLGFCRSDTLAQGVDFSSAAIGGSGGIAQLGSGRLVLNAMNTYTGPTVVGGGTLSVNSLADGGAASPIGASSNAAANLVIQNGGVFQYTGSSVSTGRGFAVGTDGGAMDIAAGTQLQFGSAIALPGTLAKTGSGTLRLTNYQGSSVSGGEAFVINHGIIDFSANCYNTSPFSYRAVHIQVNPGGNLYLSAAHALGGGTADSATSWGVVHLLGGTMTLAREQYLSGGTVNSLGRLILQAAAVNNAGAGEMRATANTSFISTLAAAQASSINVAMATVYGPFAFDVADGAADADLLVTGNLSSAGGSYGIAKLNSGKLVLTGSNSYATTVIGGGTLQIGGGGNRGTLGVGAVTDNAVLSFARSDSLTVANDINGSGSLSQMGPGILILAGNNHYLGGTFVSGGTLVLASTQAIADRTNLFVGQPSLLGLMPGAAIGEDAVATGEIVPVPEPAALALLLTSIASTGLYRRLRRSPLSSASRAATDVALGRSQRRA